MRRVAAGSVFRQRDFVILVIALGVTTFGDFLALVALTIRVHDTTSSGFAVSALLLADAVPFIVLAPLAGRLVDRVEAVTVLAVASLVQAAIATGLAFAGSLSWTISLIAMLGAASTAANPAFQVLVPHAVRKDQITSANAYLQLARYSGGMAAPIVAGWLAATAGIRAALIGDAITFLVVGGAAMSLHARRSSRRDPHLSEEIVSSGGGFGVIRRDRILRLGVGVAAITVLFAGVENVATVFFAKDVLRAGNSAFGALGTMWGVGMIAATILIGRRLPESALGHAVPIAAGVTGGAVGLTGTIPALWLALMLFVVAGGGNAVDNVAAISLIHHRVPSQMQGRVFAANSALMNAAQVGALALGGALVQSVGARGALLISGYATLAVGIGG